MSYIESSIADISKIETLEAIEVSVADIGRHYNIKRSQTVLFPATSLYDAHAVQYITHGYDDFKTLTKSIKDFFLRPNNIAYLRQYVESMQGPMFGADALYEEIFEAEKDRPVTSEKGATKEGFIIPVYGPKFFVGLFNWAINQNDVNAATLRELQVICQALFLKLCQLWIAQNPPLIKLTPQEAEVIKWIIMGKTNAVIGSIMGISRHTVDAYTRRIFIKLSVNDRVSAAMKARALGLLPSLNTQ